MRLPRPALIALVAAILPLAAYSSNAGERTARLARAEAPAASAAVAAPRVVWGRPVAGAFIRLAGGAYEDGPGGLGAHRLHESRAYVKTPRLEAESFADSGGLEMRARIERPAVTALRAYADLARTVKVVGAENGSEVRALWRIAYDVRIEGADRGAAGSAVLRGPDGRETARLEFQGNGDAPGARAAIVRLGAGRTYEVSASLEAFAASDAERGAACTGSLRQELTLVP